MKMEADISSQTLVITYQTSHCHYSEDHTRIFIAMKAFISVKVFRGCAIAQTASRWLPTTADRVRARVRSCGICGEERGTRGRFSEYRLLHSHHHPGPVRSLSNSGHGSTGPQEKKKNTISAFRSPHFSVRERIRFLFNSTPTSELIRRRRKIWTSISIV
jgi:hypothetical protein